MSRRLSRRKREELPPAPQIEGMSPEESLVALSDLLIADLSDFERYAPAYLKIQTKAGELSDFSLNEVQNLLEQIINDIKSEDRLVRLVVLKARRKGISTWVSGRFFWKTTTSKNHYSMIVTHEPEATDFIFKMHKRFLEHIPQSLRPVERYNNKRVLEFNDEGGSGLDSAIRVGTADKEDFGSGQLIHDLHLSELAKYPKHNSQALLLSLLQCVPDTKDTEIIMESTAKGIGGEFYTRFWGARYRYTFCLDEKGQATFRKEINPDADPNNVYNSIFIPWFVFSEYRVPVREPLEYTKDEQDLKTLYNLGDDQLMWRRMILENKCNGDINLFNQEYPADPMSAFVSESDNVFDPVKLLERIKIAKPPKTQYDVSPITGLITHNPKGKMKVWVEPQPSNIYVVSADVAEGIIGRDYSSIDVLNLRTGAQDATWHGLIAPDQLAGILSAIGRRYNNAQIIVERNNHGLTVIDRLVSDFKYKNLYFEMINEPPIKPRRRVGWVTTKKSKPIAISNLVGEFRENLDGIRDKETLREMLFFKQHEDFQYGAEEGHNDDRVMSLAIGKFAVNKHPKKIKRVPLIDSNAPNTYNKQQVVRITPSSWS